MRLINSELKRIKKTNFCIEIFRSASCIYSASHLRPDVECR